MKKMLTGVLVAALLVGAITVTAVAAGQGFADADGDSVCDNAGRGQGGNFVDADGDGVCDNAGRGHGRNFVDADGDGVCDNYMSENCGKGRGHCREGREN